MISREPCFDSLHFFFFTPNIPRHCVFNPFPFTPGTSMLTISATFDTHLPLAAHIFVTLVHLVHIRIERCISA